MVFSSVSFLVFFLPVLLALYYIVPQKFRSARNLVLLLASLFFYAWGGVGFLALLFVSITVNYLCGLVAGLTRYKRLGVTAACVVGIGLLFVYKYAGFFAGTVNALGIAVPVPDIVLPIGISFYTFQGLSYVIDVSRGTAPAQKNPLNVALYIALFPQLVAGPIVRYDTVSLALTERRETLEAFASGLVRFSVGLAKKMLIANVMGEAADGIFAHDAATLPAALAWLGAVYYTFQIYFDFSAYSDMAIGLGRLFGFEFCENFDYPYISRTVTEFWRRWHMSLSGWFRDYVYFPLGGSRVPRWKHVRNLAAVWLLTGLWHGANWTFILWGAWFLLLLLGEKFVWGRALERLPAAVGRIYTMLAVILSWVLFRSASINAAFGYISSMLGFSGRLFSGECVYYFRLYLPALAAAAVGSLPVKRLLEKRLGDTASLWLSRLWALLLLALSYVMLATGSFNPFIYFQF